MRSFRSALLALTSLCCVVNAQTTWNVGGGGLPQIRDALASASPGDVIVVAPGTYAHFNASIGVTIRAAVPGTVDVELDSSFFPQGCTFFCVLGQFTSFAVPAGQSAHVIGLRFVANQVSLGGAQSSHRVTVSGRATFDDCTFEAREALPLRAANAIVHLQNCRARTIGNAAFGAAAFSAGDSDITAVDCEFSGGPAAFGSSHAIVLTNARLHASAIVATGGNSVPPASPNDGGSALWLDPDSTAWISDSTLLAAPGACAIFTQGGVLTVDRSTVISSTTGCLTAPSGDVPGVLRAAPMTPGGLFSLTFLAAPGELIGVWTSTELMILDVPGVLSQPVWIAPATANTAALLLTDANGIATANWLLPQSTSLIDRRLWFQGVAGATLPLRTTAVTGGVVR